MQNTYKIYILKEKTDTLNKKGRFPQKRVLLSYKSFEHKVIKTFTK